MNINLKEEFLTRGKDGLVTEPQFRYIFSEENRGIVLQEADITALLERFSD